METPVQAPTAPVAPPPAEATAATEPAHEVVPAPVFAPGTKLREYETIYAVKPDLTDEQVEKHKERIRSLIHREGGKVIRFAIWGKKKTHYEVAKATRAIFVHVHYLGLPKLVAEVERTLRLNDDVVRYQTVKIADETDAAKPVEQDIKLAGDADQPERPPREERERREEFGEGPEREGGPHEDRFDNEGESA
jgi:small subunit ribosomal protein S6